ncbi:MAG: PstS family phosphate ABC transporter substrate-binding protein [Chloroflexota bacterium]
MQYLQKKVGTLVVGALVALALVACGGGSSDEGLSGAIEVDGSSTVFPITEAVAEEFRKDEPGVQVNVGVSGTGGGFKRFVAGETDISDASRPIKASEAEQAVTNGIEFIEMRVGTDGLSVVVNPNNDFVDCLTVAELKKIWEPGSTINNWKDVRAGFPDQKLNLYGPGTDSGTFDYFTEEINGTVQASRADYTASEDDNVLVQGVSGDRGGMGYFGFAYYVENTSKVKAVAIDSGSGCVEPTVANIEAGNYTPLSRPLYIYVNKASLAKPEVAAFVRFYMEHGAELTAAVGYVASDASIYADNLADAGL